MKKIVSIIITTALLITLCIPALATDISQVDSNTIHQSTDLTVASESSAEKNSISFAARYAADENAAITIEFNSSLFTDNTTLAVSLYSETDREPIYTGNISKDRPDISVEGLELETKYRINAVSAQGTMVDNLFAYFLIYEKNNELAVLYKICHKTYSSQKYSAEKVNEALKSFGKQADFLNQVTAGTTRYEVEPNNTFSEADEIEDDDTTYGTIGYSGDIDYYQVMFAEDGNANFWLGDIQVGTDYDLYLYDSSGNELESSTSTDYQERIYNYPVTADTWYYLKVVGYNGSYDASNYYRIRAKNYPTETPGDVYEPNNTFAAAPSIANNVTLTNATIHHPSDVDYYKIVLPTSANIRVELSNIRTSCDYDLFLYDSSYILCASSERSGNAEESISYNNAAAGTYYIKVNSYRGSSSTSYRLELSTKLLIDLTCSFTPPIPANSSETTGPATAIKDLPVQVYTVTNTDATTLVGLGTTNGNGVYTKSGIAIGSNVTRLRVTVTFDNSVLSVQYLRNFQQDRGTPYSFSYDIPIGTGSDISVSLPYENKFNDEQLLAYAAWYNGLECIDMHNNLYGTNPNDRLGKLVLRSEIGENNGTECRVEPYDVGVIPFESNKYYIYLNSVSKKDYLNKDTILHEMGHLIMFNMGVMPPNAIGEHMPNEYYTKELAYSEGWANFYSCTARGNSKKTNYYANGGNYGVDLSNATYYNSSPVPPVWKQLGVKANPYENQTNTLNVGAVLWAYKKYTNYLNVESLISPTKYSLQDVYNAAISNADTAAEKETVWGIFNSRGCAFDLTAPTVNLTISGQSALVSASDDVAVKRIEWYVNGELKKTSTDVTSDTLDLSQYSNGVTVTVKAYDPEGLAMGPRSREIRCGVATPKKYFSSIQDTAMTCELAGFDDVKTKDSKTLIDKQFTLSVENPVNYTFTANGLEDVYIYSHIIGCIDQIKLISPNGEVFDIIEYLTPDQPYVIKKAQAGTWSIVYMPITQSTMLELIAQDAERLSSSNQVSIDMNASAIVQEPTAESFAAQIALTVTARPAAVDLPETVYTNDPYYLRDALLADENIIVYCDGEIIDYSAPLSDGCYELELARSVDGRMSEITSICMTVDTVAPEITSTNEN